MRWGWFWWKNITNTIILKLKRRALERGEGRVMDVHHHHSHHGHHHRHQGVVEDDGGGGRGQNLDLRRHQALAWPRALWQTSSTDDHPYPHCHHPPSSTPLQMMTIRIIIVIILHHPDLFNWWPSVSPLSSSSTELDHNSSMSWKFTWASCLVLTEHCSGIYAINISPTPWNDVNDDDNDDDTDDHSGDHFLIWDNGGY